MYTNIRITVETDDTKKLQKLLFRGHQTLDLRTGERTHSGYFNSLAISAREDKNVEICGDIDKYMRKAQLGSPTRDGIRAAFEHLSSEIGIDVTASRVMGFTIGTEIFLRYPTTEYISLLDNHPYYQRDAIDSHLNYACHYTNSMRILRFYDLVNNYRERNIEIAESWKNINVLRYEIEYKRPSQEFGKYGVTVDMLYTEAFCNDLLLFWQQEYENIPKVKKLILPSSLELNGVKDVEQYCASYTLSQNMLYDAFLEKISKNTLSKSQRSRMKSYLQEARNNKLVLVESERIMELDKSIREATLFSE